MNEPGNLFQKWVGNPTDENHQLFRKQRDNVTAIIESCELGGISKEKSKRCSPLNGTVPSWCFQQSN